MCLTKHETNNFVSVQCRDSAVCCLSERSNLWAFRVNSTACSLATIGYVCMNTKVEDVHKTKRTRNPTWLHFASTFKVNWALIAGASYFPCSFVHKFKESDTWNYMHNVCTFIWHLLNPHFSLDKERRAYAFIISCPCVNPSMYPP